VVVVVVWSRPVYLRPGPRHRDLRRGSRPLLVRDRGPETDTLQRLRQSILNVISDAEQDISYGMPTFRVKGNVVARSRVHGKRHRGASPIDVRDGGPSP
jgi:hypothetical protein